MSELKLRKLAAALQDHQLKTRLGFGCIVIP